MAAYDIDHGPQETTCMKFVVILCMAILYLPRVARSGCTVANHEYRCGFCPWNEYSCYNSDENEINCTYVDQGCPRPQNKPLDRVPELPRGLKSLDLDSHSITEIKANDFHQCYDLETLILRKNKITHIEKDAFASLGNLTHLSLNINYLQINDNASLPYGVFDPLGSLVFFLIHCNNASNLTEYRRDFFRRKPNLNTLHLDAARDTPFPKPDGEIQLGSLKTIMLYGEIPTLQNQFNEWKDVPISSLGVFTKSCVELDQMRLNKINVSVFSQIPRLETLDLSYNPKLCFNDHLENVMRALNGSKVSTVLLRNIGICNGINTLKKDFLQSFRSLKLRELSLDSNGFINVDCAMDMSEYLPELEVLSLSYNRLYDKVEDVINMTANMTRLRAIYLERQTRRNPNPDLLHSNRYHDVGSLSFSMPESMTIIDLSDAIDYATTTLGSITLSGGAQNITVLDISKNRFHTFKGPIRLKDDRFTHRTIHTVNLSDSGIAFLCTTIFPRDGNLTVVSLDLSDNIHLGYWLLNDNNGTFLASINHTGLQILNLSHIMVRYFHPVFFQHIHTLKELVLRGNALAYWPDSIALQPALVRLDLADNQFLLLPPEAVDFITSRGENNAIFRLDLTGNELLANCKSLPFLRWLSKHKPGVILEHRQYLRFVNFGRVSDLSDLVDGLTLNCTTNAWMRMTAAMCATMVLVTYTAVCIHRHRWPIKYFFIELSRRRKGYRTLATDSQYEYDAFVAYHKANLTWVVKEMVERLEARPADEPLRLCLHHRDWEPGIPIEENIFNSIKKSRKTVVLLGRSFLRSNWCEFELQMARIHGFNEGHEIIVVVQMEYIPINQLTRSLLNLRKTHTWLELPDPNDREAVSAFWERLTKALKSPVRKPVKCTCGLVIEPDSLSK